MSSLSNPNIPSAPTDTPLKGASERVKGAKARKQVRNPLHPYTFLIRNAGKTIPLVGVIVLAVMLVASIIALVDSIPLSIRTIYGYTKVSLGVSPRGDPAGLPKILKIIKTESPYPIERIIMCRSSGSEVKSIVGKWPFFMLGFSQQDMKYYLAREQVKKIEGRLPRPGLPEALISRPVAINLGLKIGSVVQGPDKDTSYSPMNVKVVGIADTDRWLMMNSIEYQEQYHYPPIDLAMVFAKNVDQQNALDHWATKRLKGMRAETFAYFQLEKSTREMFQTLFALLNVVIALLVLVITIMMGMLINIYQSQRLVEFGLLQAIGYTKRQLLVRSLTENLIVIVAGWAIGVATGFAVLNGLDQVLMAPHAFSLNAMDPEAYRYTVPIPFTILFVAGWTVIMRFHKFDPVAVVERRLV